MYTLVSFKVLNVPSDVTTVTMDRLETANWLEDVDTHPSVMRQPFTTINHKGTTHILIRLK